MNNMSKNMKNSLENSIYMKERPLGMRAAQIKKRF
jgi:hypothetical protein